MSNPGQSLHSLGGSILGTKSEQMKIPTTHAILAIPILALIASPVSAGETVSSKKTLVPAEALEEDFSVHPISAPYWAEDSFIGTDLRPVFRLAPFPG